MSETVYFKGMLKAMEKMDGETIEAQCKRLLGVEELPSHFESYEEYLKSKIHEALKTIEAEQPKPEKRYRYFVGFSHSSGGIGRCTLERNSLITENSHIEDIEKELSEEYDGGKFFVMNYQLMEVFDVVPVKEKEYEVTIHSFTQY